MEVCPAALFVLLVVVLPLRGEEGEGGFIVGMVTDAAGAPVVGTSISVIKDGPREPQPLLPQPVGTTGQDGRFRVGPLPAGGYGVFLFGSKEHVGFSALPVTGVTVNEGDSVPVELRLRPVVRARIPLPAGKNPRGLQRAVYWRQDRLSPAVGGLAARGSTSRMGEDRIEFFCIPGPTRISPDPSFHPQSEVFGFDVALDGIAVGPEALPDFTSLLPVDFVVRREDGKEVERMRIAVIPEFLPKGWLAPMGSTGYGFQSFPDREKRDRLNMTRGVACRAVVTGAGCKPAVTDLFVAKEGMDPIELVLEPTPVVDVTLEAEGFPAQFRKRPVGARYGWYFMGPSGRMLHGHILASVEEDGDGNAVFRGLPRGTRIRVNFFQGGDEQFQGRAEFVAGENDREVIKITPVAR